MKENIYTIPVTEAYEADCVCPLCFLEERLEKEAIEYALGAAMMEPDYRVASNEKGYCNKHFERMFRCRNKLSLALVLETHLEELRKKLDVYDKEVQTLKAGKTGLFKKSGAGETAKKISTLLSENESKCMICEKINDTAKRYCEVMLYMWANDEKFREKFSKSKGLCLKHERMALEAAPKELNDTQLRGFLSELCNKQKAELEKHQELLHKFVLKFDYRYRDMELGDAQTAVPDTIEKISGYISADGEE